VNRFDAATTKQTIKLKRTKDVLRNRTTPSATDSFCCGKALALAGHQICIAKDDPPAIRILPQDRKRIAAPPGWLAMRGSDGNRQAVAHVSPLAEDPDLLNVAGALDPQVPLLSRCGGEFLLDAAANSSLPKGSRPGTMKITSSDMRPSTLSRSPALVAESQVPTNSRMARSSSDMSHLI
jgi:hypothetical protein